MKDILNSLFFILSLSIAFSSCGKQNKSIIFENTLIQIRSSKYIISEFETKFDGGLDLEEGIEIDSKFEDYHLLIFYGIDSFLNVVENDTSYLIELNKLNADLGKRSICLYSKFENGYYNQCTLSYFEAINRNLKLEKTKEVEIVRFGEIYGGRILIRQKDTLYNLRKDMDWANEMANNFEIIIKDKRKEKWDRLIVYPIVRDTVIID